MLVLRAAAIAAASAFLPRRQPTATERTVRQSGLAPIALQKDRQRVSPPSFGPDQRSTYNKEDA